MIASEANSFYQPGETFLHRSDPRLKLGLCLLIVVATFAAGSWLQLSLPALLLALALWLVAPLPANFWRVCWMLRWLLLFSLLMHLLFTDGRALLGVRWLSLDGLYSGSLVCLQMLLSVISAALLSMTTNAEKLVAAFGWFVSPLRWLGCNTDEWQRTLLLAMRFMPFVYDEMSGGKQAAPVAGGDAAGEASRWRSMAVIFNAITDGLLNRGEGVARQLVEEQTLESEPVRLPSLLPLTLQDWLLLAAFMLMLVVYGLAG